MEEQLKALLDEIGVSADLADSRNAAERWFDDAMDRVSGWYTRWAKTIALVTAVVVTVILNASALRIAERLTDEPTVRASVVAGAERTAAGETPKAIGEAAQAAVHELEALEVPILWGKDNLPAKELSLERSTAGELLVTLAGWVITVLAISLGGGCSGSMLWATSLACARPGKGPARTTPHRRRRSRRRCDWRSRRRDHRDRATR